MRTSGTAWSRLIVAQGVLALALLLTGCGGQPRATATPTTTALGQATATTGHSATPPTTTTNLTTPSSSLAVTATTPQLAPTPTATAGRSNGPAVAYCQATREDALGPFYKPDAPLRSSVGQGYTLTGIVKAANGCRPLPGARLEFWLANAQGVYDDDHRATVVAGSQGEYRFESNVPVSYGGRPPHIHIRVTAPGFKTLVTQHYPTAGQTTAAFDIFLAPE